jgi:hypothetical protein
VWLSVRSIAIDWNTSSGHLQPSVPRTKCARAVEAGEVTVCAVDVGSAACSGVDPSGLGVVVDWCVQVEEIPLRLCAVHGAKLTTVQGGSAIEDQRRMD